MEYYSLILMSIAIVVMKLDKGVNCKYNCINNYRDNYKNYIQTVIGYIRSHIVSTQIQNLKLKIDLNYIISIEEAFKPETNYNNFKNNYSHTISILNFKYTEILKNFLDYIYIILQKCSQFYERNLKENFICCVISLVEEVKNSKTMFENLHKAMMFLSYIDVRCVFQGSIVPNVIIDEINFFQKYVFQEIPENGHFDLNSLPSIQDTTSKFKNLNEFYTKASTKVNNLYENSNIIDTSTKTDSTTIQFKEYSYEDDSYLVYLICSKLKTFYNENIEIWYTNLGFEQFLNPNKPELIPPIDPSINKNDGIKALNILRQENGWQTMCHINIIYNDKLFNIDCILKDPIDDMNFQIKKEYITQLLRCRYTEIIKNYHVILGAILFLCSEDKKCYNYNCLIKLFDSFNKSKIMFEGLYTALITLKELSIWDFSFRSHSNLQKILQWVEDFLSFLNNNEFFQDNFIDKNDNKKIELIEKKLNIFINFRTQFYNDFNSDLVNVKFRCEIKEPFYNKNKIINYFKHLASTTNIPYFQQSTETYSYACNYLDNFCELVYKSCYEDLGFRKIM
ncbi:uncharacterized protein LOC126898798 [Daktulosphaira vitifoliae]|uniref:uncharacterized protein LOC126898798 n=1 Tax=Daktulosphaira vitifoliae TaxID=58002 RepID=UPI0021AA3757|nr:uncharacterized protein LOC126898798 [Daktulosphaira vitifoliae]